jgi:hypothetical protein
MSQEPKSPRQFKERAARSPLHHTVSYSVKGIPGTLEASCLNVSQTGMFLGCSEPPAVGSEIEFQLLQAGVVFMRGSGTVVRVVSAGQAGAGVFFTSLEVPAGSLTAGSIDPVGAVDSSTSPPPDPRLPQR